MRSFSVAAQSTSESMIIEVVCAELQLIPIMRAGMVLLDQASSTLPHVRDLPCRPRTGREDTQGMPVQSQSGCSACT